MVTSSKRWNHCAVASEFRADGKHIRPKVVLDTLTAMRRDSRSDGERKVISDRGNQTCKSSTAAYKLSKRTL